MSNSDKSNKDEQAKVQESVDFVQNDGTTTGSSTGEAAPSNPDKSPDDSAPKE